MQRSFDEALQEMDKVIAALEKGDVPLEEAVKAYKHGMEEALYCRNILKEAKAQFACLDEQGKAIAFEDDGSVQDELEL